MELLPCCNSFVGDNNNGSPLSCSYHVSRDKQLCLWHHYLLGNINLMLKALHFQCLVSDCWFFFLFNISCDGIMCHATIYLPACFWSHNLVMAIKSKQIVYPQNGPKIVCLLLRSYLIHSPLLTTHLYSLTYHN